MKKEYSVKVTWSRILIAVIIFVAVAGFSFGVGMKVNQTLSKISITEMEQNYFNDLKILKTKHNQEVDKINEELFRLKKENRENYHRMLFFRNYYEIYVQHLNN